MADVHRGKTTLWEKKANDSVDSYAKMGAAEHLLCESDVNMYRGFKCLVKESAKWAAYLRYICSVSQRSVWTLLASRRLKRLLPIRAATSA
eukprot:9106292-Pyramimonas_sp.AAC.1